MFCEYCETDTYVIDDHTTGDCVCTNCGVVLDTNCIFKESFDDSTRSSTYGHAKLVKKISKICERYSISVDIADMVDTWLQNNHSLIDGTSYESISVAKIKVGICVINLLQFYSNPYVSMTEVRTWSSKLSIDEETVVRFLDKLKVFKVGEDTNSDKSSMNSCKSEWISSLQRKCFQILTDIFTVITIERNKSCKVKRECVRIIQERSTVSIVGIEYLSACVIKHLFQDEFQAIDNSLIICLRLNKNKFLSSYRMIYR